MDNNQIIMIVLIIIGLYLLMQFHSESLSNTSSVPMKVSSTAKPVTIKPIVAHPQNYLPVTKPTTMQPTTMQPTTMQPTTAPMTLPPQIVQQIAPVAQPAVAQPANAVTNGGYSCQNPATNVDKILKGSNQLTAEDLLPKYDSANDFAKENPVDKLLKEQNFLVSGYHMGINTVMQSNKIPYHDLRSAPQVPKQQVGPWSQSSYEEGAGFNRRYFELGA